MTAPRPDWLFDDSPIADPNGHGERAIGFLRSLHHPKSQSRDKSFHLSSWQERLVRRIYGPCDANRQRQVRTVFLQVGRGNRKTSLGAGLAALHTFGFERVTSGQNLVAAADRKQARIAFEELLGVVEATPWLNGKMRPVDSRNRLHHHLSKSIFEAISADAATQYGRTPSFALVDELWAHKKSDLWHAIRTGVAKVPGTLMIIVTTAGRGTETPDFPIYDYARKVALGEIDDPGFLPVIFEAPRESDWRDEKLWHQVNPGLVDGFPDLAGLRQLAREAADRPAVRDAFRQFHLGVRLDHSHAPFVDMDVYDEGIETVDLDVLALEPCWIAVDMSTTTDLTAVVACWKDGDSYAVAPWFFCPEDNLRAREERDVVPYVRWAEEGFITPTSGNVVDYRAVESLLRELCERFPVREIAFDPAYAQPVMAPLMEDGFPVVTMRQGWVTQAPAVKELERAIIGRRFQHGGHPVLRWCFDNVAVHTDSSGNRTMHKGKSRDRIDGATATWMAVGRASEGEGGPLSLEAITGTADGAMMFLGGF